MNLLWSVNLIFFLLISGSIQGNEKNRFIVQLINVGAHFPKSIKADWVTHPYQLTSVGMRQMYLLGREIGKRYIFDDKFLKEFNHPGEVEIKAAYSNDNLTISSAYAYTKGLYPPGAGKRLTQHNIEQAVPPYKDANFENFKKPLEDANLPYYSETVPIMVNGGAADYDLSATDHCEGIKKMLSQQSSTKSTRENLFKEGKAAFEELKKLFAIEIKSLEKALEYRDYFISAATYSQEIKEKVSVDTMKMLNKIHKFVSYEEFYSNKDVAKVVSNGVLNELETELKKGDEKKWRKLLTYVVEEKNLFALLKLIDSNKAKDITEIPFASVLEIRVIKDDNQMFVTTHLNDVELNWSGNQTKSLSQFNAWLKDNTLPKSDFKRLCIDGTTKVVNNDTVWVIAGLIMAVIMVLIVIWSIIYSMRKKDTEEKIEQDFNLESTLVT